MQGDSTSAVFIPDMIQLHLKGLLPYDKIVTTCKFSHLNTAAAGIFRTRSIARPAARSRFAPTSAVITSFLGPGPGQGRGPEADGVQADRRQDRADRQADPARSTLSRTNKCPPQPMTASLIGSSRGYTAGGCDSSACEPGAQRLAGHRQSRPQLDLARQESEHEPEPGAQADGHPGVGRSRRLHQRPQRECPPAPAGPRDTPTSQPALVWSVPTPSAVTPTSSPTRPGQPPAPQHHI
jgi:hypothetical protein